MAALLALLFTWMQVSQTGKELQIIERGQVTGRYNAAVDNLGSASLDERLGGIYALEQIMQDSARDRRSIVAVLTAYARQHAPVTRDRSEREETFPKPDIQAVMDILGSREYPERTREPVDLRGTSMRSVELVPQTPAKFVYLRGARLDGADLRGSYVEKADLRDAVLNDANLSGDVWLWESDLTDAYVNDADLSGVELSTTAVRGTDFAFSKLEGAMLCSRGIHPPQICDMTGTRFSQANLTGATLEDADLRNAWLCPEPGDEDLGGCPKLTDAVLSGANLQDVLLSGADLRGAKLNGADLRNADLSSADLRDADLTGAKTAGAILEKAKVAGCKGCPSPD
ncbi:pentapeptide repeat-containing protein [Streptomyces swartbergensis]|nr:pentapeptide repeat-containing protein [Streptomyces swartbergensis]